MVLGLITGNKLCHDPPLASGLLPHLHPPQVQVQGHQMPLSCSSSPGVDLRGEENPEGERRRVPGRQDQGCFLRGTGSREVGAFVLAARSSVSAGGGRNTHTSSTVQTLHICRAHV